MQTLCHCVRIVTRDDIQLGFTSHDQDLVIDGLTYQANTAIDPTAFTKKLDLSTDNFEVKSFLDSEIMTAKDIRGGLYQGAVVTAAIVDFINLPATLEEGIVLAKGQVGEISLDDALFFFEIRSKEDKLNQAINQSISPICRYTKRLDDPRCGLDKTFFAVSGTITAVTSQFQFTISGSFTNPQWFNQSSAGGYVQVLSGANQYFRLDIDFVSGSTVGLKNTPPYDFEVGDEIIAIPACNGTWARCLEFGNTDNHGGFFVGGNWMPTSSDLNAYPG